MMIIPVKKETWELCTALLGDAPTNHGRPSFLVVKDGWGVEQIFAWELEEYLPANNARSIDIMVYTEIKESNATQHDQVQDEARRGEEVPSQDS